MSQDVSFTSKDNVESAQVIVDFISTRLIENVSTSIFLTTYQTVLNMTKRTKALNVSDANKGTDSLTGNVRKRETFKSKLKSSALQDSIWVLTTDAKFQLVT